MAACFCMEGYGMKVLIAVGVAGFLLWLLSEFADAVGNYCDDVMWRD